MRSPARKTTASLRPLGLPATRCCTQACQQIATLACQRVHDRRRQARAHRTGPGQRVPVSVALSALGTVLVADRKPETKPRTGNSPIYRPSTRSRRSPGDSVRLRVRHAASDRDGADGSVHAEHRSPLSSRFLNRVRRSDSCRGHSRRTGRRSLRERLTTLDCRMLRLRRLSVRVLSCAPSACGLLAAGDGLVSSRPRALPSPERSPLPGRCFRAASARRAAS